MTPDPYSKGGEFYSEPRPEPRRSVVVPLILLAAVVAGLIVFVVTR